MSDQRRANQAWEEGARALGFRRPNEPSRELDFVRARNAFKTAVELDPTMADAWLGLHASGYDPDTCLDKMVEHLAHFGETRTALRRSLHSRYPVGYYCRSLLETWEDLMLAQAARYLVEQQLDLAANYLQRCRSDKTEKQLLIGRLLFARGDYEAMLPVMQGLTESRAVAAEAHLYTGIALARRELYGEAERVLAAATGASDNVDLLMEATYFRGMVLRNLGKDDESRSCLEWVYRHNPRYRDVAQVLADPSVRLPTEPLRRRDEAQPERLADLMAELDAQIGLAEVKQQVRAVTAQVHARRLRAERGLPVAGSSNHLVFAGPPGTGKTTVARLIGRIYCALGVLTGTAYVEVARQDLVAEYVGQTAPKTNAKIDEAMDGVLFIDEAYSLSQGANEAGTDSYGREAIETLLKRMEDDRQRLVVIIAGYKDRLEEFLGSNPGLRSRFTTTIEFRSYTPDELVAIAGTFATAAGDRLAPAAVDARRATIDEVCRAGWIDELGNGRFVRNLHEAASRQRDLRLFDLTGQGEAQPDNDQLATIEGVDLDAATEEVLGPVRRRHAGETVVPLRRTESG